jgi:hypothetical protein
MKHITIFAVMFGLSVAVSAQTTLRTAEKASTTVSTAKQGDPVFTFSTELEQSRVSYEKAKASSVTSSRSAQADVAKQKDEYLAKLQAALITYKGDAKKTQVIQSEIDNLKK